MGAERGSGLGGGADALGGMTQVLRAGKEALRERAPLFSSTAMSSDEFAPIGYEDKTEATDINSSVDLGEAAGDGAAGGAGRGLCVPDCAG